VALGSFIRLRPGKSVLVAGCLGVVATLSTAAALASGGGSSPVTSAAFASGARAPLATSVEPADQSAFGILRRAVAPSDAVPASASATLGADGFAGMFGANLALAREVTGLGALGLAWVVPGDGSICLIDEGNVAGIDDAFGGSACEADAGATTGQLETVAFSANAPGTLLVAGVVPDGVTSVQLDLASGGADSVTVHDNVYMAEVQGAAPAVEFTAPGGAVDLAPIAVPASTP
jgi:hypothetical protein